MAKEANLLSRCHFGGGRGPPAGVCQEAVMVASMWRGSDSRHRQASLLDRPGMVPDGTPQQPFVCLPAAHWRLLATARADPHPACRLTTPKTFWTFRSGQGRDDAEAEADAERVRRVVDVPIRGTADQRALGPTPAP